MQTKKLHGMLVFLIGTLTVCSSCSSEVETVRDGATYPSYDVVYVDSSGNGQTNNYRIMKKGQMDWYLQDSNEDGTIDVWKHYDTDGDLLVEMLDRNHDGRIDLWMTHNEDGTFEHFADKDFDGEIDEYLPRAEVHVIP